MVRNSLFSNESGATYTFQAFEVNNTHEVSLWWTYYNNRCVSVPVDIYDGNTLIDTVYVDQLTNGEQWNVLGTYDFSGTARIVINSQGGCTTSADAVKVGSTLGLTFTYSGWMDSNSYTTNFTDAGTHTVTVTVNDGEDQDSQDVTITVNDVNQPPVLAAIASITVNEGDAITITPSATDPDAGNVLAYTYTGWMTSASYTTDYTDAGTHLVTVTVGDGNLKDSQDVTITVNNVNRTPVLGPISPITVDEGQPVNIPQTGTDPDVDGTLEYTYTGWMTSKSYTAKLYRCRYSHGKCYRQ